MVLNDWRQGLSEQSHGTPSETERTGAPETAANKKLEPLVIASHMPTSAQLLRARCEVPAESVEALGSAVAPAISCSSAGVRKQSLIPRHRQALVGP